MVLTGSAKINAHALDEALVSEPNPFDDLAISDTSHSPHVLVSLFEASNELRALGVIASIHSQGIYLGFSDNYPDLSGSTSTTIRGTDESHDPLLGNHYPLVGGIEGDGLHCSAMSETIRTLSNIREQDVIDNLAELLEIGASELFQELSSVVEEPQEVHQESPIFSVEAATAVSDTSYGSFEELSLSDTEGYLGASGASPEEMISDSPRPSFTFPQRSELTEQELDSGEARVKKALGQGGQIQINPQRPIPGGTEQGPQVGGVTPAAIVAAIILTTSGAKIVKDWLTNHQKL